MILFILLLEFCLALAAVGMFFYLSAKEGTTFMDWMILVLLFFAVIKLANVFMVFYSAPMMQDVIATLDLGFATAFTAFVFLRCREVGIV